jgi:hypothetical protein
MSDYNPYGSAAGDALAKSASRTGKRSLTRNNNPWFKPKDWSKKNGIIGNYTPDKNLVNKGKAYLDSVFPEGKKGGKKASGGSGGGGGAAVDPYAGFKSGRKSDRARLEALYQQYQNMIGAGETGINQNFGTAATNLGNAYGGAVQNINAGYDAARAAQTAQLQALGLTDVAPPTSVLSQANTASDYEKLKAAALAQNEANRISSLGGQQAIREAVGGEQTATLKAYDAQTAQQIQQMQAQAAAQASANAAANARNQAAQQRRGEDMALKWYIAQNQNKQSAPVDVIGLYNQLVSAGTDPQIAVGLATNQAKFMGG